MANKNYLIAGGSSGIGLALVKNLVKDANHVWVISRTNDSLLGMENVHHIQKDLTNEELQADELPGEIHGLAYCPGSINLKPFRALKPDHFRKDLEINLIGAVKVLQAAQKALKAAKPASVVFFSTVAVGQGMPFHASVAAAKGAIEGLSKSLAAEWAPDIRVNCIAPSLTDTPLAARLLSNDAKREASANRHPLKKVGTADDIAQLANFLLREASGWISGQVIGVDGGMSTLRTG